MDVIGEWAAAYGPVGVRLKALFKGFKYEFMPEKRMVFTKAFL